MLFDFASEYTKEIVRKPIQFHAHYFQSRRRLTENAIIQNAVDVDFLSIFFPLLLLRWNF